MNRPRSAGRSPNRLRIATRRSPLAMWQAEYVADRLRAAHDDLEVEFVSMDTTADQRLDIAISELGGKGAFSKEVQQLVLADHADIAVHSAKDLQAVTPEGLVLGAFPVRGEVRDCLVGCRLEDLAEGAIVATGSNRRRVQLASLRPDLEFRGLRGNIATRLGQLDQFAAMVMATTALERLGTEPAVVDVLDPDVMIPQVGQGALAVECRSDDPATIELLATIDDAAVRATVSAERDFLVELGGDCTMPAGANAWFDDHGALRLRALLASADEQVVERIELGPDDHDDRWSIGTTAAKQLRARVS
ncbi:MAG: hydroxymethylbilane synthase [Acidimicrobiales bacterium]